MPVSWGSTWCCSMFDVLVKQKESKDKEWAYERKILWKGSIKVLMKKLYGEKRLYDWVVVKWIKIIILKIQIWTIWINTRLVMPVWHFTFIDWRSFHLIWEETQDKWFLHVYISIWLTKLLQNRPGFCLISSNAYTATDFIDHSLK